MFTIDLNSTLCQYNNDPKFQTVQLNILLTVLRIRTHTIDIILINLDFDLKNKLT